MSSWPVAALGELADLVIGRTPPRNVPHYWTTAQDRPFCSIADMTARMIVPEREGVSEAAEMEGKAKRIPAGALLMSFKLTIGRTGIAGCDLFPNEAIVWIRPKPGAGVELDYLRLYLPRHDFSSSVGVAVKGATLNQKTLAALQIPLPDRAEQRRFVDLMTSVESHSEASEALRAAAESKFQALLSAMLGPRRADAEDWPETTIGAISTVTGGVAFPKRYQGQAQGDHAYFKVSDMNAPENGRWMGTPANWITEEQRKSMRAHVRPAGTVVFPIIGAALKTEKRRILSIPGAFDQNVIGLVPGPDVNERFLLALMETISLARLGREGPVPLLNQEIVGSIPVRLPPIVEQEKIAEIIEASASEVAAASALVAQLDDVKSALLSSLLSGALEIPESYDRLFLANGVGPEPMKV